MISVITPVYNGERFIESCIQVVIDQNCFDVEHLLVDGGSRDRTVDIIKQYAEQYPHIHWISEADRGQSDAMNKGIQMAKGEVLAILNVDDYYEQGVLNRIVELFKALPEPYFLVGNCNIWGDHGQLLGINKPSKLKFTDLLLGFEVNPHPVNPSAYFYHKSLHDTVGMYNIDEHYAMDVDFILRAVQVATAKYMNETWGNYRYIEGTKTYSDIQSGQSNIRMNQLLKSYKESLPFLKQMDLEIRRRAATSKSLKRIRYFAQNPNFLLPSIKSKFSQAIFKI